MVSLRSGGTIEANNTTRPTSSEVTSTKKARKQHAGAGSVSDKKQPRSPKTARRPTKPLRVPSRLQEKIGFLSSPAVHTRSAGPVPAISLSTELPELPLPVQADPEQQPLGQDTAEPKGPPATAAAEREQEQEAMQAMTFLEHETVGGHGAPGDHQDRSMAAVDPYETADSDSDAEEGADQQRPAASLGHAKAGPGSSTAPTELLIVEARAASASAAVDPVQPSTDASDEEDSESDEEPLGGLASSLLAALQRQRQAHSQLHKPGRSGERNGPTTVMRTQRSLAGQPARLQQAQGAVAASGGDAATAREHQEILWQPETNLPGPVQAADVRVRSKVEAAVSKQLTAPPRDKKSEAQASKANQPRDWHELPITPITDEVKRDLRLLRLRGAMDTKRFYKKAEKGKFPTRFAVGTVIEGPTEWYSGRVPRKQRKQTITDELLADPELQASRKRRFGKLQEEASRWSHKKHKGSGEHLKKKPKRPKH